MKRNLLSQGPACRHATAGPGSAARKLPRVLNVLDLNPTDKFGSLEEQVVYLHQAFAEAGSLFLPLFSCPPTVGVMDNFHERRIAAYCLNLREFRWSTFFALRTLIKQHRIGLIHWHFTEPLTNAYVWLLSVWCPTLGHFYADHISRPCAPYKPLAGWKKTLKRMLLKRYEQTWCVSGFVKDCLTEQGTWANVHVCPHFINTDRFMPNPAARAKMRRECGVEDRFVVAVIAQLIAEKGIDVVLRAMTELPEKAVLWLVGTGNLREELQTRAKTLRVSQRVRFLGLQRQVEPFLHGADCLVLPSLWKEAAGLVLLEAQAVGVPVVASRIGGIPEYVREGRSGFLFTPEDAGELAGRLRALCDDSELRRRMGHEARALAVERFSVSSRLSAWLELYSTFSSSARSAPCER